MTLTITGGRKDFLINFDEKDFKHVENAIAQCIAGNYFYLDIKDVGGKTHYIPAVFIKDSYTTIK